jgi:AraC-like DNA-binding protein
MDKVPAEWFTPTAEPRLFQAPPGWRWQRQPTDHWNCWCALAGRAELTCRGQRFAVRPGACFLLPPHHPVEVQHDAHEPALNLAIHGRFPAATNPPLHIQLGDPQILSRFADDCLAAWAANHRYRQIEYAGLAGAFVARLHRLAGTPASREDAALTALVHDIRRRPAEPWTVADCARRLGLSRSQVTRRFRTAYGVPPATIIARSRDDFALQLLRESTLPLTEIAARAGYADASHLGRRLRRRLGRAPGGMRDQD